MPSRPSPRSKSTGAPQRPKVRELAAQTTRDNILKAATKVFARHGFAGGRIEQISKSAKSYDRMIYYYFGNKEGLFVAVIEDAYHRFNEAESQVVLNFDDPIEDLKTLVRFMWTYYRDHPEFITLLNSENLQRGKHISKSMRATEYSLRAISLLAKVLDKGVETGLFRPNIRARDVYLMSAALAYFYLSNRYTLSKFLGEDLESPEALAYWEEYLSAAILRHVLKDPNAIEPGLNDPT